MVAFSEPRVENTVIIHQYVVAIKPSVMACFCRSGGCLRAFLLGFICVEGQVLLECGGSDAGLDVDSLVTNTIDVARDTDYRGDTRAERYDIRPAPLT